MRLYNQAFDQIGILRLIYNLIGITTRRGRAWNGNGKEFDVCLKCMWLVSNLLVHYELDQTQRKCPICFKRKN